MTVAKTQKKATSTRKTTTARKTASKAPAKKTSTRKTSASTKTTTPKRTPAKKTQNTRNKKAPTAKGLQAELAKLVADKKKLKERIIWEMEQLVVSEGRFAGERLKVFPWEADFIDGFLDAQVSALTEARGNGKTSVVSGLGRIGFTGCLRRWRGQVTIVASSLDQGRLSFDHIESFMDAELKDKFEGKARFRLVNNAHQCFMEDHLTKSKLTVLGSDAKRAHGRAQHLIICDEPAKWVVKNGWDMFNALKTSLGKQFFGKMVVLGTRPEDFDHWFAQMVDEGRGANFVQRHACTYGEDDDFSMESILKANPSYDYLPDLREAIANDMADAQMGGEALNTWRALRLNMGVPEVDLYEKLIPVKDWDACCQPEHVKPREGPVAVGIDLGDGLSMSCVVLYWPTSGRLEIYGALPADPDLEERGKKDGVGKRYLNMKKREELMIFPGKATNNGLFLQRVFKEIEDQEIISSSADRYKKLDVEQAVAESGIGWNRFKMHWRPVGKGPDGSADIRAFRRAVAKLEVNCSKNLMMESAIRESIVKRDDNGNLALYKARQKGRNDAVQAGILSVGIGQRWLHPTTGNSDNVSSLVLKELYQ